MSDCSGLAGIRERVERGPAVLRDDEEVAVFRDLQAVPYEEVVRCHSDFSEWRDGRLPLIDGVVPAPLDADADWATVDERGAVLDSSAGLRYSCGEGSAGGDGYVACERVATSELVWAAFFQESNPFETLRLVGAHHEAVNKHGHHWRFARSNPAEVSVT